MTLLRIAFLMKAIIALFLGMFVVSAVAAPRPLSNGKTFAGWFGDTNKIWRVEDGAFVGGKFPEKVPHNEFLKTDRPFSNFVLHVKFRLLGTNGFVNGGVQIRSTLLPPFEMKGYQCDMGDGWWGALYDESRRNKVLVKPDPKDVTRALKLQDWNEYLIRAEGKHIQSWINGVKMIDYTEEDDSIPQHGQIGLQVHGGGVTEAWYKDITIDELP
jgi:hypothetical protein